MHLLGLGKLLVLVLVNMGWTLSEPYKYSVKRIEEESNLVTAIDLELEESRKLIWLGKEVCDLLVVSNNKEIKYQRMNFISIRLTD